MECLLQGPPSSPGASPPPSTTNPNHAASSSSSSSYPKKKQQRGWGDDDYHHSKPAAPTIPPYRAIKLGNFLQLLAARAALRAHPPAALRPLHHALGPLLPFLLDPASAVAALPPAPPLPQHEGQEKEQDEEDDDGWGALPSTWTLQPLPPPPTTTNPTTPTTTIAPLLPTPPPRALLERAAADVRATVGSLNDDQERVLQGVLEWFDPSFMAVGGGATLRPPVLLVHGVFGSGARFCVDEWNWVGLVG